MIQQFERALRAADLVSEIVGDPAVGINIKEMLMKMARKKPGYYAEIFRAAAGQAGTVATRFPLRGRSLLDGVVRRQTTPGLGVARAGEGLTH